MKQQIGLGERNFSFGVLIEEETYNQKNDLNEDLYIQPTDDKSQINKIQYQQQMENNLQQQTQYLKKKRFQRSESVLSKLSKEKLIETIFQLKGYCRKIIKFYNEKLENKQKQFREQKIYIKQLKSQISKLYNTQMNQKKLYSQNSLLETEISTQHKKFSWLSDYSHQESQVFQQTENNYSNIKQSKNQLIVKSQNQNKFCDFLDQNQNQFKQNNLDKNQILKDYQQNKSNKKLLELNIMFKEYQDSIVLEEKNKKEKNVRFSSKDRQLDQFLQASSLSLIYCIFNKVKFQKEVNHLKVPSYLLDFISEKLLINKSKCS